MAQNPESPISKQDESPKNAFGLTAAESLAVVERRRAQHNDGPSPSFFHDGRFSQSSANYVQPAPSKEKVCGACRFFLRSNEGELGRCQVVEGDIAWFATSDYFIAAEDEAAATFEFVAQKDAGDQLLSAFWKQVEGKAPVVVRPWVVQKKIQLCTKEQQDPDKPLAAQKFCVLDEAGAKVLSRTATRSEAQGELSRIERFSKAGHLKPKASVCDRESSDYSPAKCRARMSKDGGAIVSTPQELRIAARKALETPGCEGLKFYDSQGEELQTVFRSPEIVKSALEVVPPAIPDTARVVFVAGAPTSMEASRGVPLAGPDGRTFRDVYAKALGLPSGDWGLVHAIPTELDVAALGNANDVADLWSMWSGWFDGIVGKDDDTKIVVALGKLARNLLGERAAFHLPHPAAVRKMGDKGEVARKMRAIRKRVIADALKSLNLTGGETDTSIEVELAFGAAADNLEKSEGWLIRRSMTPMFKANADELQVVYGVVLTPYGVDTQEDWPPPAEIQKAAHNYVPQSRVIGLDHEQVSTAFPVESWLESYPSEEDYGLAMRNEPHRAYRRKFGTGVLRSGEWVMGTKVPETTEWSAIRAGERASYSIGGSGFRTPGNESQMPAVEFIDIG
jgi:hypothetical protein